MGATPLQAFILPDLSDASNVPVAVSDFANGIEKYVVMRFTTTAARDAAITVPEEGMVAYCTTPDRLYMYTGTAWVLIGWTTTAGRPGVILTDAAQSIASSASFTDITWGTEVSDVDGWTSGASATLTVPTGLGGRYGAAYFAAWASSMAGATPEIKLLVNGTALVGSLDKSQYLSLSLSCYTFAAGDTIKVQVSQQSGGAINVVSRLEIVWLGP